MSPIHDMTVALVLSFLTGIVSPKSHVEFDPSFANINCCYGNLVPPSYWQSMCGFIKGNKSVFVHYEKHDPLSLFISPSYKGRTTSDNSPEPEEHA